MSQLTIDDILTKHVIAVLMLAENIGVRMPEIVEKSKLSQGSVEHILTRLIKSEVVVTHEVQTATCHTTEIFYQLREIGTITICCN